MTAVCPRGHTSQSDDYCDQCGARMDSPPSSATGRPEGAARRGKRSRGRAAARRPGPAVAALPDLRNP